MQLGEGKQSTARQIPAGVSPTQRRQGHRQGGQGKGVLRPPGNPLETIQLQTGHPKTNPPVSGMTAGKAGEVVSRCWWEGNYIAANKGAV